MFPGYVWTFDDAIAAFERWLDQLGGELSGDIDASTLENDRGDEVLLRFGALRVRFPAAKTLLEVALDVDILLTPTYYKFDFRQEDGTFLWRYDMHKGHEREFGVPWHIHEGSEQNRLPSEQVDLVGIAARVVAFNADCKQ